MLSAEEILLGETLQSTQLFSLLFFPGSFLFSSRLLMLAPFSSFSHQDVLQLCLGRLKMATTSELRAVRTQAASVEE